MNGTSFQSDIRYWLKQENSVNHLMFVNIIIFLVLGIIYLPAVFNNGIPPAIHPFILYQLELHVQPDVLLTKPWGILTYMFVHTGIFHIFFNMLNLYWFGNMFRSTLGNHRVLPLYILSGIVGALVYLAMYLIFPANPYLGGSMIGASAAVMCFLVASATLMPNVEIGLLFIGSIKLKWVAIGVIIIDIIAIPQGNVGGILAHLGGAAFGFAYVRILQNGTDLCAPLISLFGRIAGLFDRSKRAPKKFKPKKSPLRVVRKNETPHSSKLDELLDKINEKGYDSLSADEKQWLRKYSDEK